MAIEVRTIREATDAVCTALDCLAIVRSLVEYHAFDDQLVRFSRRLVNFVAVVFAAQPIVQNAVVALRSACPDLPEPIGEHSAASYHELAIKVAAEPLLWILAGMDRGFGEFLEMLTGQQPWPQGTIAQVEKSLVELGGQLDAVAAIARLREQDLTDCDLERLKACVQKEGALAAGLDAAPTVPLNQSQQDIVDLVRRSGHRLTTTGVLAGLAACGIEVSEGMTKQTLATLVQFGVLTNDPKAKPRGYGLPEWDES